MHTHPLKPSVRLLVKLGDIVNHAKDLIFLYQNPACTTEIEALLADTEVVEWLDQMDKAEFLPKKRS
jgi:hypothetical protein